MAVSMEECVHCTIKILYSDDQECHRIHDSFYATSAVITAS